MRILALPAAARALIFDIDGTLYTNAAYQNHQEDVLIGRLAAERGESVAQARGLIARMRSERESVGLRRTSLGNLFAELGVDMATSVRWRTELIEPAAWLVPDARLADTLGRLAARYALAAVTNNPRLVGEKGLIALGVAPLFRAVVGLDDTMVSKPAPEPFLRAAGLLGIEAARCVSVGDRRDVDLEPALDAGMGAILVDGVEDVYELPRALDIPPPRDML
jgi:HAD superfamily hydrolase (TIGR01509 family)